jgi:hypothetical protein
MNPIYHKYTEWEDFQNGMYSSDNVSAPQHYEFVNQSKELLRDQDKFFKVAIQVVTNWVKSTQENLTKKGTNKKAWIGQASCSLNHKATEKATKEAWGELTEIERELANSIAEKVIKIYETKTTKLYQNLGESLLF